MVPSLDIQVGQKKTAWPKRTSRVARGKQTTATTRIQITPLELYTTTTYNLLTGERAPFARLLASVAHGHGIGVTIGLC